MFINLSDMLRTAAYLMMDEVPSEEAIRQQREQWDAAAREKVNAVGGPAALEQAAQIRKNPVGVKEEAAKQTSHPKIKPPRRQNESSKEWNEFNSTEKMREYMKDYRSTGEISETSGAKNVYVKKLKGN